MLKTSSTKSAELRKSVVGVSDGGKNKTEPVGKHEDDGDETLSSKLRSSSSTTHQLERPRLWLSLMGLMLVVELLANRSKNHQKVKESLKVKKSQRPERSQRSSVWRNVYRSTDSPSIKYEELELLLEL